MSRSNWYFLASVVGFLALATVIWIALRPAYPIIPTSEYQKAQDSAYSPGGPRCYPSRLSGLTQREASDERYRCEQAAEQQRLKSDDLVQQTRAAEAAIATVGLNYGQSLMMLAGTIFGLLTLFAAVGAVLYARRAAVAAESDLNHAQQVSATDLRPWIKISVDPNFASNGPDRLIISCMVTLTNIGRTPAKNVRIGSKRISAPPFHTDEHGKFRELSVADDQMEEWSSILPGDHVTGQQLLFLEWDEGSGPTNADGKIPHKILRPIIAINVTYEIGAGIVGRTARSFWIGVQDPVDGGNLSPIASGRAVGRMRADPGLQSEIS